MRPVKTSAQIDFASYKPGSPEAKQEYMQFFENPGVWHTNGTHILHMRENMSATWHAYRALRQYLERNGGDPLTVIRRFEQYAMEASASRIQELHPFMVDKICWQVEDDAALDAILADIA